MCSVWPFSWDSPGRLPGTIMSTPWLDRMRWNWLTSASRGTLSRITVWSVRRLAIIRGRVAFLAPEIGIVPSSRRPPTIRIRSMRHSLLPMRLRTIRDESPKRGIVLSWSRFMSEIGPACGDATGQPVSPAAPSRHLLQNRPDGSGRSRRVLSPLEGIRQSASGHGRSHRQRFAGSVLAPKRHFGGAFGPRNAVFGLQSRLYQKKAARRSKRRAARAGWPLLSSWA